MNWHPTPSVRGAVPVRTVGMYVRDEKGVGWGTLTIWNGSRRCQWCHAEFSIGWTSDVRGGSIDVCKLHIVVDWSAPWLDEGGYTGVGDPIHQRPRRRRKAS